MRLDIRNVTMDDIMAIQEKLDAAVAAGDAELDFVPSVKGKSALLALILHWLRAAKARGLAPRIKSLPEDVRVLAQVYGIEKEIGRYVLAANQG